MPLDGGFKLTTQQIKELKEKLIKKNQRIKELTKQLKNAKENLQNNRIYSDNLRASQWELHHEVSLLRKIISLKYYEITFSYLTTSGHQSNHNTQIQHGFCPEHAIYLKQKDFKEFKLISIKTMAK